MLFLISLINASMAGGCATDYPSIACHKTVSTTVSYCTYDSVHDKVACYVFPDGAASADAKFVAFTNSWEIHIDDSGSELCCDKLDFPGYPAAGDGLDNGIYVDASGVQNGPMDSDFSAFTIGHVEFHGSQGDDTYIGSPWTDIVFTDDGTDYAEGGSGPDEITGGTGSSYFLGEDGSDILTASDGCDNVLIGGINGDYLYGSSATCTDGHRGDYLDGGDDGDHLDGKQDEDTLCGGGGEDILDGGLGDDYLYGGYGNDWQTGAGGTDECENESVHSPITCESNGTTIPYTTSCPTPPAWPWVPVP